MPRQARLRAAGIPWHVRQRANNGIACFVEAEDRELYLGLLGELAPKAGCHVHAYVLMTNHTHLLVTPAGIDSVPRLMKHLGERYSRHFNQRRRRYGTLWEGRYRSSIVDSDAYLLTCYRYIELNPVRAGMCTAPHGYRWSSHAANAYGAPSLILQPHPLYLSLGRTLEERARSYRGLFGEPLTDDELFCIRHSINGGFALGTAEFLKRLGEQLRRKVERQKTGRPPKER